MIKTKSSTNIFYYLIDTLFEIEVIYRVLVKVPTRKDIDHRTLVNTANVWDMFSWIYLCAANIVYKIGTPRLVQDDYCMEKTMKEPMD